MSKPNVIVLDRRAARYFVDVALSAASRDDITPVICGALVQVTADQIRVTCTDRYRAHSVRMPFPSDGVKREDFEFIMPRAALLWLSKNLAYFGSYAKELNRIRIEVLPHIDATPRVAGGLTVAVLESELDGAPAVAWSGSHTLGNFPGVYEKVILKAREAEPSAVPISVNLALVVGARVLGLNGDLDAPTIKFTTKADSDKPGPLYMSWTRDRESEPYAEALVQPRLVLR